MSTISCSKAFSIVIEEAVTGPIPDAWWKMDEASGSRVDQVAALALGETVDPVASMVGKVGTAASFFSYPPPGPPGPTNPTLALGATPALDYIDGTDITVCGWFRIVAGDVANSELFLFLQSWANGPSTFQMVLTYNENLYGANQLALGVSNNFSPPGLELALASFTPTPGTWIFWTITYDASTGVISLYLNNALEAAVATILFPGASHTATTMSLAAGIASATVGMDEVAIFLKTVTAAERAFLYNSGAGRTYPY